MQQSGGNKSRSLIVATVGLHVLFACIVLAVAGLQLLQELFFPQRSAVLRVRLHAGLILAGWLLRLWAGVQTVSSYLSALRVHLLKYSPSGTRGRTGPAALEPVPSTAPVGACLRRHSSWTATQPPQPGSTAGWYCRPIQPTAAFQVYFENHHQHVTFFVFKLQDVILSSTLWIWKSWALKTKTMLYK